MRKFAALFLLISIFVYAGCDQKANTNETNNVDKQTTTQNPEYTKTDAAYVGGMDWYVDLEKAKAEAKETGNYILVNFTGSDWCPWCFKLRDEVFVKEAFVNYAKDNLVLMVVDKPRSIEMTPATVQYNDKLINKYGILGFPTVLLLDQNGDVVAQMGYQPGGPEKYIEDIKKNTNQS